MKETKQRQANSLPHSASMFPERRSHTFFPRHDSMMSCHASPVALLQTVLNYGYKVFVTHTQHSTEPVCDSHTNLKSSIRARKKVLKLLCWLMALSTSSSIAMFPNSCETQNPPQHKPTISLPTTFKYSHLPILSMSCAASHTLSHILTCMPMIAQMKNSMAMSRHTYGRA